MSSIRFVAAAGSALLAAIIVLSIGSGSHCKEKQRPRPRFYRPVARESVPDIPGYGPRASLAAAVDTYCIAAYDFEQYNWQGWTGVDNTAQADTFVRVEDFAGLSGGAHGRLVPIEGTKSIWFGTRPGDSEYLCSWSPAAPGYGNNWDQLLVAHFPYPVLVEFSYHLVCDTEEGHDVVRVGWSLNETEILAEYSGVVDTVATHYISDPDGWSEWGAYFFFGFSSDGAVSDEDGLIDTDGAVIIDSITIRYDGILGNYEDFESYEPGETECGHWSGWPEYAYETYSGLMNNLLDHDPCNSNFATVIIFFEGSSYPSGEYPDPGLYVTPFCHGSMGLNEPCQDEMVVSPWLDLDRYSAGCDENQDADIPPGELAGMGGCMLTYSAYLDNPVENLVFHTWKVRNMENGCPGRWLEEPLVRYYSDDGLWYRFEHDISDLVTSDSIQVALGVVDMCSVWYGLYGDCAEHTPAPWFDNVKVSRYAVNGPQWSCQRADLFQDKFPSTDDHESWVRADMAADISPISYPGIVPGDSVVVTCRAPGAGGLDTLATGEARVYCHVNVSFLGPDGKPDLFGSQLEGSCGTYVSDDGDWTVLLCEPARASTGVIAADRYCVDLNDSLFTRGYMVEYYFKAYDLGGGSSTYPPDAESIPPSPYFGSSNLLEFTCLPTLRDIPGVLYVDDFDGRGTFNGTVQEYFDRTFYDLLSFGSEVPDRYDVNSPSSGVSNGVGAYAEVVEPWSIFCAAYNVVIFDSGDLDICTISEGTEHSDKSNDALLLMDWAYNSQHKVGLLVMGDQVATDLGGSGSAAAHALVETICGINLENDSYYRMTGGVGGGGIVSPIVTGVPFGPFEGLDYYAFGGCPYVNSFDVLEVTGQGMCGLQYPDYGGQQYCAAIVTDQLNYMSYPLKTVWAGHSFMYIRNVADGTLARNLFFRMVWDFFEMEYTWNPVDSELPKATGLSQNFPNPFNPITRMKFSLKKKGHVSMRIYDVSGRLVCVLVNEVREAGSYEVVWDGTNDGGRKTASGIYFCRMEAEDYERTLKMVQLR